MWFTHGWVVLGLCLLCLDNQEVLGSSPIQVVPSSQFGHAGAAAQPKSRRWKRRVGEKETESVDGDIRADRVHRLGFLDSGKYSKVYSGKLDGEIDVVLKVLKPTAMTRVQRELSILQALKGVEGIITCLGTTTTMTNDSTRTAIVMEHFPDARWLSHRQNPKISPNGVQQQTKKKNDPWEEELTSDEVRGLMHSLLRALSECHRRGIMHRDVKPRNVLWSRTASPAAPAAVSVPVYEKGAQSSSSDSESSSTEKKKSPEEAKVRSPLALRLIDFGLSEFYEAGRCYSPRVASRCYKAPELLFQLPTHDCSIDVWAAGCVLAGLVFRRSPFYMSRNTEEQMVALAEHVGSVAVLQWAQAHGVILSVEALRAVGKQRQGYCLQSLVCEANRELCSDAALDLIGRMLALEASERPTAEECLCHDYFAGLSEEEEKGDKGGRGVLNE